MIVELTKMIVRGKLNLTNNWKFFGYKDMKMFLQIKGYLKIEIKSNDHNFNSKLNFTTVYP